MITKTNILKSLNKTYFVLATAMLFFVACSSDDDHTTVEDPGGNDPVIVEIPDDELREIVMETLNVANPSAITTTSMAGITELNLSNSIVADLTGIEAAVNLEVLLGRNIEVADLSPLGSLTNLKRIDMRDAVMEGDVSLSFLSNLNAIENIDFQNTSVNNISVLSGKNSFTHINLRETDVVDISALQGMTQLMFLNLNRAGGGNGIDNPEVTIPMENLYYLSLRNTIVGDELMAQIFANKTQMVEANIRNTDITDISFLVPIFEAGAFTQELSDLYDNKISLDLQNNAITNLCVIEDWVDNFPQGELEWSAVAGDFNNCDEEDPDTGEHEFIEDEALLAIILNTLGMSTYQELTEESILDLIELNIQGSAVTSLAGLENATNLQIFNARDTEVSDISALEGMENLVFINLRESAVSDISPLEGMTQLQYLNLNRAGNGDGITNPEIIAPMVNLYYLSLRNTPLTAAQFEMFENFTQLVECNIRNTGITSIAPLAVAFENGAFTEALSEQYGNGLSLDLQNNDITDLCLIADYVSVFPDGELEWSGSFSFDDCE